MWLKKSNTDDNANSTYHIALKETGCCGTSGEECQNSFTANFANAYVSITVDGVSYAFANNATNIDELKTEVRTVMVSAGYLDLRQTELEMMVITYKLFQTLLSEI